MIEIQPKDAGMIYSIGGISIGILLLLSLVNKTNASSECTSTSDIPPEYQPWVNYMNNFLNSVIFAPPSAYKPMQFGLHLTTASSGLEFWDMVNSNDVYSDWSLHFNLDTNKHMVDMAKEVGVNYIQIRTRYPDNNYIPGSEEALHELLDYIKSSGIDVYLMYNPLGLEHIHVPYGDISLYVQKFEDFVNEYIKVHTPKYYQLYSHSQTLTYMGVDSDILIPQMYSYIKSMSPTTNYVDAEGAWTREQLDRFKALCDSPYNDLVGIPLHDLYYKSYRQNLSNMVMYAKSKKRLISPDVSLTDFHADKLYEIPYNTGWREQVDRDYIDKVINLAQVAGFESISLFYGNMFISYNTSFYYTITKQDSNIWVNCLQNNSRTSLPEAYRNKINAVK